MANRVDLTGERFGKLIVLGESDKENKTGNSLKKCLCDCGNIKHVFTYNLKSRHTLSCGCLKKINYNINSDKDLKKVYGQLRICDDQQFFSKIDGHKAVNCICSCGKNLKVKVTSLKSGYRKSCGHCLRVDLTGLKLPYCKVIKFIGFNEHHQSIWKCHCICGNYFQRTNSNFNPKFFKPESISCGCRRKGVNNFGYMSKQELFKKCEFCECKFTTFNTRKRFCTPKCAQKKCIQKNLQMKGSNLRPKD